MTNRRGRHRSPHPIRDFIWACLLLPILLYYRRRPRVPGRLPPLEIVHVGLTMADALAAAQTSYQLAEPCPWGLSAGACAKFHPVDHVSRYADAPVAQ